MKQKQFFLALLTVAATSAEADEWTMCKITWETVVRDGNPLELVNDRLSAFSSTDKTLREQQVALHIGDTTTYLLPMDFIMPRTYQVGRKVTFNLDSSHVQRTYSLNNNDVSLEEFDVRMDDNLANLEAITRTTFTGTLTCAGGN